MIISSGPLSVNGLINDNFTVVSIIKRTLKE